MQHPVLGDVSVWRVIQVSMQHGQSGPKVIGMDQSLELVEGVAYL